MKIQQQEFWQIITFLQVYFYQWYVHIVITTVSWKYLSCVIKHLPSAMVQGFSLYHLILKGVICYPCLKGEESAQGHMTNKWKNCNLKEVSLILNPLLLLPFLLLLSYILISYFSMNMVLILPIDSQHLFISIFL